MINTVNLVIVLVVVVMAVVVLYPRLAPTVQQIWYNLTGKNDDADRGSVEEDSVDIEEIDLPNVDEFPLTRVMAYWTNWATYRVDSRTKQAYPFPLKDINLEVVTHPIYSFFSVGEDYKVAYSDAWSDIGLNHIQTFIDLKKQPGNKIQRLVFSVGGWTYSGETVGKGYFPFPSSASATKVEYKRNFAEIWHDLLTVPANRTTFAQSIKAICDTHHFDGFDWDLEYPGCPNGNCNPHWAAQNQGFLLCLDEIRRVMGKDFFLSIASAAGEKTIAGGPDMFRISERLDQINIMTYDYHVANVKEPIGHNQPKVGTNDQLDVKYTIEYYLSLGVPAEKLNIGVALYGRGFVITDSVRRAILRNKNPQSYYGRYPSRLSPFQDEKGVISTAELCLFMKEDNILSTFWVPKIGSFALTKDNRLYSYTDVRDVWYINQLRNQYKIPGLMLYAVDQDDNFGFCGAGKNPIANLLKDVGQLDPYYKLIKPANESED